MKITHKLYESGAIRDSQGKLVAFFDQSASVLHIDNAEIMVLDADHAMEIVGENE